MSQLDDMINDIFIDENSFEWVASDDPEEIPPVINTVLAFNTVNWVGLFKLIFKRISFSSLLLLKNTLSGRSVLVHIHLFEILWSPKVFRKT